MIQIITGSTLGGSEYVGDHLSDLLEAHNHQTNIHNQPDLSEIPTSGTWLIVTSTHGAGEFPDNIQPFIESLKAQPPTLNQLKYAVVAIGDSSYDTFCSAGKEAFKLLTELGATPISACFTIDILENPVPEDAAEQWLQQNISSF
ncbi:FMN-binding protein MioC [Vibrio sp. T187]|uniref:FMN-binding protein MioC n=1 Tax=Vibrio TaxID=662 RepID=UPI0010C9EFDD|nr:MULTISPECIES: FMN-binding protein MioC [Vibrio]MBW3698381.1 FMN-binding protein MioC [Vibrio sp. T187]